MKLRTNENWYLVEIISNFNISIFNKSISWFLLPSIFIILYLNNLNKFIFELISLAEFFSKMK